MINKEHFLILNETISLFQKGLAEYCQILRNNRHSNIYIHNALRDLEHIENILDCLNQRTYFGYMHEVKHYFTELKEGINETNIEQIELSLEASKLLQNALEQNLDEDSLINEISAFSIKSNSASGTRPAINGSNNEKLITRVGSSGFIAFNQQRSNEQTETKKDLQILVVEDESSSRRIMEKLLSPYGKTTVAISGEEALSLISENIDNDSHYDIIFLDINLPAIDGKDVLKNIREIEKNSGIEVAQTTKVIMTTGDKSPLTIVDSFNTGCDGYLKKPLNSKDLKTTLKNLKLISK